MNDDLETLAAIQSIAEQAIGSLDMMALKLAIISIEGISKGAIIRANKAAELTPSDTEKNNE